MTRNTKIALGVVGGVSVLGVILYASRDSVKKILSPSSSPSQNEIELAKQLVLAKDEIRTCQAKLVQATQLLMEHDAFRKDSSHAIPDPWTPVKK